jgi:hypothetical protein
MLIRSTLATACLMLAQAAPAADSWAFSGAVDGDSQAAVDLRALNERAAGESGFIGRTKDGEHFTLGNGKPVRFWGVDSDLKKAENADAQAAFLARRGVNLVRFFAFLEPDLKKHPDAKIDDINREQLDLTWRWVAALKKQGVYATMSPYWAFEGTIPASWGVADHKSRIGVLFCDPAFQAGYRAWLRALYTEKNPYTGVPLAQEPAVAVIQLQNEDSLLFWSLTKVLADKGAPLDELRAAFGAYATKKYKSLDAALAAWQGTHVDGDDAAKGQLGLYDMWTALSQKSGGGVARAADEFMCLAQLMRDFNLATADYLRTTLGCKQLINAGNWKTADNVRLNDLERWSGCGNEVMAVNRYYSTYDQGPDIAWAMEKGQRYVNASVTTDPAKLPLNIKRPVGHPFMITETLWLPTNLYQSEASLMAASYAGLTGVDALLWCGTGNPGWGAPVKVWKPLVLKFDCANPACIGQFPAAAWIYRTSAAQEGPVVVHEERATEDLQQQRTPLLTEDSGYDPTRDAGLPKGSAVKTTVDPLAFLTGRVEVVYDGDPAKSHVADLAKLVDTQHKTVRSATGQLSDDYGAGVFSIDAPKAQGACGFLGRKGAIALHDATIACANDYASIVAVALDDQPLATSGKVLVQVGTTCRPTGWTEHADTFPQGKDGPQAQGFMIDAVGADPWQVACAAGTVTIKNPRLASAVALDERLARGKPAAGAQDHGAFTLTLPADALYVLIEAK